MNAAFLFFTLCTSYEYPFTLKFRNLFSKLYLLLINKNRMCELYKRMQRFPRNILKVIFINIFSKTFFDSVTLAGTFRMSRIYAAFSMINNPQETYINVELNEKI